MPSSSVNCFLFLISVTISVVTGEKTPVPVKRSAYAFIRTSGSDLEAPVNLLAWTKPRTLFPYDCAKCCCGHLKLHKLFLLLY